MIEPLPKWIQRRYAVLWGSFKNKQFSHEQAVKLLKDKETVVSVFLSDLKKAGWLEIRLDQKDSRIRWYLLKSPEEAIKGMIQIEH